MTITGDSLTSGKGIDVTSSASNYTGYLVDVTLTGTTGVTGSALSVSSAGVGGDNKSLIVSQTGATSGTDYGLYVTNTGASTTNVGGYFSASGATNNYGLLVANGYVGIGTTTPAAPLHVSGNTIIFGEGEGQASPTETTVRGANAAGTDRSGADLIIQSSNGTGTGGSGDIRFRTASGGQAVTYDTSTSAATGTSTLTAISWSHTVADQSNRMLIVGVVTGNTTVSSVSYGTQTMTQVRTDINGTSVRSTLFYLVNPDVGTNTITVVTAAVTNIAGTSVSYYGVDPTVGSDGGSNAAATTTYTGAVVSSAASEVVIDIVGISSTTAVWSPGANQSAIYGTTGVDSNANSANMSTEAGAASVTMSWTADASVNWASSAVALQPYGGGSSSTANTMTDRLVITSAGAVGVNSSTPVGYFDVNSGALTVDNNSGSYVGIGTTTPVEKLNIEGGNVLIGKVTDTGATTTSWLKASPTTPGTLVVGGTTGILAIDTAAVYNGTIYVGTNLSNSAEIYKYTGGVTWTKVSQTTAGTIASGGTANIDRVKSLVVYNGYLYAGINESGAAQVLRYDGGTTWTRVTQTTAGTIASGGTANIDGVWSMAVFNGNLYIGTNEGNATEVYRYDGGTTWTKVSQTTAGTIASGGTSGIDAVSAMAVYNNSLYIGVEENNGAEIYRYDGGTTWTRVSSSTPGTINTGGTTGIDGVPSMATYNGGLYIGTYKNNNAEIYRYDNGTGWFLVNAYSGLNVTTIDSLMVYNGRLHSGAGRGGNVQTDRYDGGTTWTTLNIGSGQFITGGNTGLDTAGPAATVNGEYFQFAGDTLLVSKFSNTKITKVNPMRLNSRVASDNALVTELPDFQISVPSPLPQNNQPSIITEYYQPVPLFFLMACPLQLVPTISRRIILPAMIVCLLVMSFPLIQVKPVLSKNPKFHIKLVLSESTLKIPVSDFLRPIHNWLVVERFL